MTADYSRIVYLNGQFMPAAQATVSVMDRGFLFGDGVYEVIPIFNGHFFRPHQHLHRLQKSLDAIQLSYDVDETKFMAMFQELLAHNKQNGEHQFIYIQITRGKAPVREHIFPEHPAPTLFAQCTPLPKPNPAKMENGGKAMTTEDIRWHWCFIKTIALLPNVLLAQRAKELGLDEAIWVRDGMAMEGTSSNLFIVKDDLLITPPLSEYILGGITRDLILELAKQNNIPYQEQPIPKAQLFTADEVWMTGSTKEVLPITEIEGKTIGSGKPGPLWRKMKQWYENFKQTHS